MLVDKGRLVYSDENMEQLHMAAPVLAPVLRLLPYVREGRTAAKKYLAELAYLKKI